MASVEKVVLSDGYGGGMTWELDIPHVVNQNNAAKFAMQWFEQKYPEGTEPQRERVSVRMGWTSFEFEIKPRTVWEAHYTGGSRALL